MRIQCSQCNAALNVPERLIGKQGRCPKCATIINIVAEARDNDILFLEKSVFPPEVNKLESSDSPTQQKKDNTKSIDQIVEAHREAAANGNQQREHRDMKKCPYCAEDIRKDAVVCKHCKSNLVGERVQEEQSPPTGWVKFLLYFISGIIPIVGLVLGIIYLVKTDRPSKMFGVRCLIFGIGFFLVPLFVLGILIFVAESSSIAPFIYTLF